MYDCKYYEKLYKKGMCVSGKIQLKKKTFV